MWKTVYQNMKPKTMRYNGHWYVWNEDLHAWVYYAPPKGAIIDMRKEIP